MQDYTKDLVIELGKDVLSSNTKTAIKTAINNAIKNSEQGKGLDFESLFKTVMKSCMRTVLYDVCGKVVAVDSEGEEVLTTSFYKLITGEASLESTDYKSLNIEANESLKKVFKMYDYGKVVKGVADALDNVKTAEDMDYYNAVEELSSSFLTLANTMAGSVPVIGDIIKSMISVASGSFEAQYNYIMNDLKTNNTAMAQMVLYQDLEEAALYLLAQENLIFDEESIVTMLMDKKGLNKINSPILVFLALVSDTHEDFIHNCAKAFDFIKEDSDYIDADIVRSYCVKLLINNGYALQGMSYEDIQKELSILESNLSKNGGGSRPVNSTVYWNVHSYTYNAAFHADAIKNNASTAAFDPLVIDMGKTGFELTDVENGVNFDMDVNGFAEKTGWITGDDAFLALDRNGNGIIDNGGELFGDRTLLSNGTYASSGFEALAEFDSNLDRLINAHDEVYRQLRLWQDKNHDGICTPDELMTLEEAGISAINLNYESMNKTDDTTGSVLSNVSSVVFEDGTETAVGEFKFNADKIDTKDIINFELSEEILSLPNVRAIGGVHSLHYAMAMDETGTLQSLGSSYVDVRHLAVVL